VSKKKPQLTAKVPGTGMSKWKAQSLEFRQAMKAARVFASGGVEALKRMDERGGGY